MAGALAFLPCSVPHMQRRTQQNSSLRCGSAQAATLHHCPHLRLGYRQLHSARSPRTRQVTTMGLFGLGLPELAVLAGVTVLVFGPSKLPGLGKELGKTVKSFQSAAKEFETELKNAADDATKTLPEDEAKRR